MSQDSRSKVDHFSDVVADDLFAACANSPLKLDLYFFFQPYWQRLEESAHAQILFVFPLNKNTLRPAFNLNSNPTSAKFSDCNQVRRSCRLRKEAAVQVGEIGRGQDNKRSAGAVCVRVPCGGDCRHS